MTIKAILFDKDGTLLDYHATWTEVNLKAATTAARGEADLARELLMLADADPETGRAEAGGLFAAGNSAEIAEAWISQEVDWSRAALIACIDEIFTAAKRCAYPRRG